MAIAAASALTKPRAGSAAGALVCLASGAMLPLAFAPFDLPPVSFLCIAVLFAAWRGAGPRRAAWWGALFGLGQFGVGVSWVYVSIYQYGGGSVATALGLTGLLILVLACFPAALGCVLAWAASLGGRCLLVCLYPAGWALTEWLRGWVFTGFPWLSLGYSQMGTPLSGYAPLLGVYGVSWATALTAALMLVLWRGAKKERGLAVVVLGTLWIGGAWLQHVEWTTPTGTPLRVSLVQGNVSQGLKWLPRERLATLDLYAGLTRRHWDSDLIVWPETAVPMFFDEAAPFLRELGDEARTHGVALLVGVPYTDLATGRYYNSLVSLGAAEGLYHKHHLVPFTEYLPLREALGKVVELLDVPMSAFSAGPRDQMPFDVGGVKVAGSICYEAAFPEQVNRALPVAQVLVNVSNDAWFGNSFAPHQHLQIARMRSVETGRPMLRATNTGITALIDQSGRVQAKAPQFKPFVLTGTVQPYQGETPYVRVGNAGFAGLAFIALVLPFAGTLRRKVRSRYGAARGQRGAVSD